MIRSSCWQSFCVNQPTGAPNVMVTLDNAFVGHEFPSGAAHDRRVWLELHASANGTDVLTSGATLRRSLDMDSSRHASRFDAAADAFHVERGERHVESSSAADDERSEQPRVRSFGDANVSRAARNRSRDDHQSARASDWCVTCSDHSSRAAISTRRSRPRCRRSICKAPRTRGTSPRATAARPNRRRR